MPADAEPDRTGVSMRLLLRAAWRAAEASIQTIPRGHGQYSCCVVSKPDEGIADPYAHGLAALLAVELDAQERGYKLGTESNGAFTVSNSSSTSISMLYSNEDIQRCGRILAGRPR